MENQSPERVRVIAPQNMEEFVIALCKRPGMYVGENKLDKIAAFLGGYHAAFYLTPIRSEISSATREQWDFEWSPFSTWLCDECFADIFGEAVGSVAGWANFLIWLADDDAEAFVFLPILYHEFTAAIQDAGGSRALRDRLGAVELTSEERWALREEEDPEKNEDEEGDEEDAEAQAARWKAEREARKAFLRAAARPLMQKAVEDAANGIDRPLAAHVAAMRAAREAQKAHAAALLQKAAPPQ